MAAYETDVKPSSNFIPAFSSLVLFGLLGLGSFFLSLYLLFFTEYYYLTVLYYIWLWWDRKQCIRGGRRCACIRQWRFWTSVGNYFPIKIIKTAELDPNKNYVCGYHPHGGLSIGFASFATEATGFSRLFPGIKPSILVLAAQFWAPVYREFMLALGGCSVSRESISWLLSKEGKGNMLLIIVGGGSEMFDAHPGMAKLNLKKRKGFVKLAIAHGASLVPIFGFGENDIISQISNPKGSMLRKFQDFLYNRYRMALPMLGIRGLFPYQRPVNVVVGKPIDVVQNLQPTDEQVDHYHKMYINSLEKLFNKHKKNYKGYENVTIEIL